MRKWRLLLWAIPVLVLAVLFAAITFGGKTSLSFLAGRSPLPLAQKAQEELARNYNGHVSIYTYQGGSGGVKAIQAELKREGFTTDVTVTGLGSPQRWVRGLKPGQSRASLFDLQKYPHTDIVAVYENVRHFTSTNPNRMIWGQYASGWVSVLVKQGGEPTLLDRLRSWIGI